MNTISKLTALATLLACTGVATARNAAQASSVSIQPASARINPQPLPPAQPDLPDFAAFGTATPAAVLALQRGPIGINPQPLPPRVPGPT
jgi:hypothetical protein